MKIILIVRDPVIRTISDFTQVLFTIIKNKQIFQLFYTKIERNKTQIDFETAIFLPNSTNLNRSYKPIRNSLYSEHFKYWKKNFPQSQILILDGDKFITNPLGQVNTYFKII